ncbi:MAG: MlaA family lipoprotein [Pseudomonadota bacterium]|jgi:phospholipid-binding lipoprotein MlaA
MAWSPLRPNRAIVAGLFGALLLAGCASGTASRGTGFNDPYESSNRQVHAFNKAVDQTLFGGGGQRGVIPKIPRPIARGFGNFTANLGEPGNVLNSVLQGRPDPAALGTLRFAVNTTFGIGGLFDVASALGMPKADTDFGQTLQVWGVPEGAYLEMPFIGPTTERDIAGTIVGLAVNPANRLFGPPESSYVVGAYLTARIGDRQRFAETVESVLYESADSYAQSRLIYLQNRRFKLGEEAAVIDPNEDPYAK